MMQAFAGIPPVSAGSSGNFGSKFVRGSSTPQFPKYRWPLFPMFELECPKSSPDPSIEIIHHLWCFSQTKVRPPADQETFQFFDHDRHTLSASSLRDGAHSILHLSEGLFSHTAHHDFSRFHPEGETQEFSLEGPCHFGLRFIDLEPEATIKLTQQRKHAFPSTTRTDINLAVVRVADKSMASPFKLLVDFIEKQVSY